MQNCANVSNPIIGVDSLNYYNLIVDVKNRRLVDETTLWVFEIMIFEGGTQCLNCGSSEVS